MLYAVKPGPNGPQLRSIRFPSDLENGEVAYDGPLMMSADGITIDMVFDKTYGLRPKLEAERLEDEKKVAIASAKQACEKTLNSGCLTSKGIKMDCDDRSVSMLVAAVAMYNELKPETVTVCDFENVTHTLTLEEFFTLVKEVGAYVQSVYQKKWTLRNQILEVQSSVELQSIVWS